MLDKSLKEELTSKRFEGEFIIPSYGKLCLSNVPATIASFFGLKTRKPILPQRYISSNIATDDIQNIVLMVLDGFGYNAWLSRISDGGFFQTLTEGGLVFPITTVFPSTTPAALTTLSTGLTPQEHGLPEYHVYLKELDMIIATLPFSPMGDPGQDTLLRRADPADPGILFSGDTIYNSLRRSKVDSISLLRDVLSNSAYTHVSLKGSEVIPYHSLAEYAVMLRKKLRRLENKTLVYAYWDSMDWIGHKYGPNTDEWEAEISAFSDVLKREFLEKVDKETASKTLLIVTSDHGQINVSPSETVYLNDYQEVVSAFQTSEQGKAILPSWSPRDMVLHLREDKIEDAQSTLSEMLNGKAVVLKTKEAISMGLFGLNRPSTRFTERAGDILILPRRKNMVWYEHTKGRKFDLLGMHGGLSEDEMLIPFAISKLSDLSSVPRV